MMSKSGCQRCMHVFLVLGVTLCSGSKALAQPTLDPLSSEGPFHYQAALSAHGRVAVHGDISLVAGTGVVHVFERNPDTDSWTETTQLTSSDSNAGFGRSLSFDGTTAVVGAGDAAYVFRRNMNQRGRWREVGRLQPSESSTNFGALVAVDRGTTLVTGGNAVYVFVRTEEGDWVEGGKLTSPELPESGFGLLLDLSGNTAIVVKPTGALLRTVFVFERTGQDPADWHLVNRLPQSSGFLALTTVKIDNDTIVVAGGDIPGYAMVFERDSAGDPNWQQVAQYRTPGAGSVADVAIDGNRIVLSGVVGGSQIEVLARNQGGFHTWGPVSRFRPSDASLSFGPFVATSGDTMLFGFGPTPATTLVYVSDQDGDGLRDDLDRCARDPLNNLDGSCQRATWAYPVLDDLVERTAVSTATPKRNRHVITMTFTNTSSIAVRNPFFEVTAIDNHCRLLNADGDVDGVGASLSPDVGDGTLSPGESVTVSFEIAVQPASGNPVFDVTFKGEPAQQ